MFRIAILQDWYYMDKDGNKVGQRIVFERDPQLFFDSLNARLEEQMILKGKASFVLKWKEWAGWFRRMKNKEKDFGVMYTKEEVHQMFRASYLAAIGELNKETVTMP